MRIWCGGVREDGVRTGFGDEHASPAECRVVEFFAEFESVGFGEVCECVGSVGEGGEGVKGGIGCGGGKEGGCGGGGERGDV